MATTSIHTGIIIGSQRTGRGTGRSPCCRFCAYVQGLFLRGDENGGRVATTAVIMGCLLLAVMGNVLAKGGGAERAKRRGN